MGIIRDQTGVRARSIIVVTVMTVAALLLLGLSPASAASSVNVSTPAYVKAGSVAALTATTNANTECLVVAAAKTSKFTSTTPRRSWQANFTAAADGSRSLKVTVYSDVKCTKTVAAVTRNYTADGVAPVTKSSVTGDWRSGPTTVRLTASDARSGVSSTTYSIDGGAAQRYTLPVILATGPHTMKYASTDKVGNIEATHTLAIGTTRTGLAMTGLGVLIADPTASNGQAILTAGPQTGSAGVARGTYTLTARIHGLTRGSLSVDGREVWSGAAGSSWQSVTVPVFISGPASKIVVNAGFLDTVSLTSTAAQYTVAGNAILDPTGAPVTLRGVNRNGLDYMNHGYYSGMTDVSAMSDWGSNIVRVQMSEDFWLTSSCQYSASYQQAVDTAVYEITQKGMVALLDLHTSMTDSDCPGAPSQQKMADTRAITFWGQVAARYANDPLVAFDLYNEPHDIPLNVWRDGGQVDDWQAAGMQQMYNAVRGAGATNLVFVSGTDWAYSIDDELLDPLDGYGIVMAPHVYYGDRCSGLPLTIDVDWGPTSAAHPVVITEFGSPCATSTYNTNVINYAESRGLGWVAFLWADHANGGPYGLLDSFTTYAPDAQGQPVRDALWAARGWTTPGGR
ncbi:MAG TPA: glycoside hydrolase family 5 protein [Frankiaceae bacterium]|nr:glycoside hydrolase family 5 protein [Frankiaceae bacterium]